MATPTVRMRRRERKQRIREVWEQTFGDLDPAADGLRADRVRGLCPCEHRWSVPLWDIIFAACHDPSPIVRYEALHVIEDSAGHGFPDSRGMGLLAAARSDPDPGVRRFAEEALRLLPRIKQIHKERDRQRSKSAPWAEDECEEPGVETTATSAPSRPANTTARHPP
jgi:hypothetical protein